MTTTFGIGFEILRFFCMNRAVEFLSVVRRLVNIRSVLHVRSASALLELGLQRRRIRLDRPESDMV